MEKRIEKSASKIRFHNCSLDASFANCNNRMEIPISDVSDSDHENWNSGRIFLCANYCECNHKGTYEVAVTMGVGSNCDKLIYETHFN